MVQQASRVRMREIERGREREREFMIASVSRFIGPKSRKSELKKEKDIDRQTDR